ncbi:MAG: hypothetical protein K0M64_02305 [Rhizobium sp.]|nr:hypothetical protein [Rhizobium sp.]
MKSRNLLVLMLVALLSSIAHASTSPVELGKAARSIDSASRTQLGIGLKAVSLLLQAGPNTYHLVEALQQEESWLLLKDLEKKGFVTLSSVPGPEGELVSIRLTATGMAIVEALSAP